jgi:hypothetical protein
VLVRTDLTSSSAHSSLVQKAHQDTTWDAEHTMRTIATPEIWPQIHNSGLVTKSAHDCGQADRLPFW